MGRRIQKAREYASRARNRAGTWWEWKGKPAARKLHTKTKREYIPKAKATAREGYRVSKAGYTHYKTHKSGKKTARAGASYLYRKARDRYGRFKKKRK